METLLDLLVRQLPSAKRTTIRRMLADGRIRVGGQPATRANQQVGEGVLVEVLDTPTRPSRRPDRSTHPDPLDPEQLQVIHEDADLIVVNKPPGLLTSTVPHEKRPTLVAMIRRRFQGRLGTRVGVVHRLDQDASGLLVFSLHPGSFAALKRQLSERRVKRCYAAVVSGVTDESGVIRSRLRQRNDGKMLPTEITGVPLAVTQYRRVRSHLDRSLLEIELETGKKHQIRVHLSANGWPIVGDRVYGGEDASRLMLAAVELELTQPTTGKRLSFRIPSPAEFERAIGGPTGRSTKSHRRGSASRSARVPKRPGLVDRSSED